VILASTQLRGRRSAYHLSLGEPGPAWQLISDASSKLGTTPSCNPRD
jgi:hypothetical protein